MINFSKSVPGQASLVATLAVTLIVGLGIAGLALSQLGGMNSQQSISIEKSIEAYYCARSGIEEVLAERMVPRSNYLALNSTAQASSGPGVNAESGKCYQEVSNSANPSVIGMYRYIVLGGDLGRDITTGNFISDINQAPDPNEDVKQHFFVVSQGTICQDPNTKKPAPNTIQFSQGGVSCSAGYNLQRLTVLSEVDLAKNSTKRIVDFRVVDDPSKIQLSAPVWVPGLNTASSDANYGVSSNPIDFETVYKNTAFPKLYRVAFYQSGKPIIANFIVNDNKAPATAIPSQDVKAPELARIYFAGGVDYRTAFTNLNTPIQNCLNDPSQCNIKLYKTTDVKIPPNPTPIGQICQGMVHLHANCTGMNTNPVIASEGPAGSNVSCEDRLNDLSLQPNPGQYIGQILGLGAKEDIANSINSFAGTGDLCTGDSLSTSAASSNIYNTIGSMKISGTTLPDFCLGGFSASCTPVANYNGCTLYNVTSGAVASPLRFSLCGSQGISPPSPPPAPKQVEKLQPIAILPSLPSSTEIVLKPKHQLTQGKYRLEIANLQDYNGNKLGGTIAINFTVPGPLVNPPPPPPPTPIKPPYTLPCTTIQKTNTVNLCASFSGCSYTGPNGVTVTVGQGQGMPSNSQLNGGGWTLNSGSISPDTFSTSVDSCQPDYTNTSIPNYNLTGFTPITRLVPKVVTCESPTGCKVYTTTGVVNLTYGENAPTNYTGIQTGTLDFGSYYEFNY